MCHQFYLVPKEVVEDIIRDIERNIAAKAMPDWPAKRESAFPKAEVAVIAPQGKAGQTVQAEQAGQTTTHHLQGERSQDGLLQRLPLQVETLTWGYHPSWSKQVIFNTRVDTAMKPGRNMWTDSIHNRRCVVPTYGFFEPHQSETTISSRTGKAIKQQYFFHTPEHPVTFIAGVYEEDHFSLMTTEPNAVMRPIHNRMPLVLSQDEVKTWLYGEFESLFDRSSTSLTAEKA